MKIDFFFLSTYLNKLFPDSSCALKYQKDFELLIAILLSSQTTDVAVNKVTPILFTKFPTLLSLKNASENDIKECIKSLGMSNTKARHIKELATIIVDDYAGIVPNTEKDLLSLPGVGNKTKNCYLAERYHHPLWAIDTHVQRISKRIGVCASNDDVKTIEQKMIKFVPKEKTIITNHQLIDFGRAICKATRPRCDICELATRCKNKN